MHSLMCCFAYFIIYSFLGWCCEVGFAAAVEGKFVNRGFLNGPVCPIYGFGIILLVALLKPFIGNIWLLMIFGTVVTSVLELATGFVLEKVFHEKWWDYTDEIGNIGGYVCIKFSLLWGLAGCAAVKGVHPVIAGLVSKAPKTVLYVILAFIALYFIADTAATVVQLMKLRGGFKMLEETERRLRGISDKIGAELAERVIDGKEYLQGAEEKELLARCKRLLEEAELRNRSRLMRAFPNLGRRNIKINRIKEFLERKGIDNAAITKGRHKKTGD